MGNLAPSYTLHPDSVYSEFFPVLHKVDNIGIFVQLVMEISSKQLRV